MTQFTLNFLKLPQALNFHTMLLLHSNAIVRRSTLYSNIFLKLGLDFVADVLRNFFLKLHYRIVHWERVCGFFKHKGSVH